MALAGGNPTAAITINNILRTHQTYTRARRTSHTRPPRSSSTLNPSRQTAPPWRHRPKPGGRMLTGEGVVCHPQHMVGAWFLARSKNLIRIKFSGPATPSSSDDLETPQSSPQTSFRRAPDEPQTRVVDTMDSSQTHLVVSGTTLLHMLTAVLVSSMLQSVILTPRTRVRPPLARTL